MLRMTGHLSLLLFLLLTPISAALAVPASAAAQQARSKEAVFYYEKGAGYFKEGKYQEALEEFKQSLRHDPHFMAAQFLLADSYSFLARFEDAIKVYDELIREYPRLPPPYYNRSYTYLLLANGPAAVADAETCLNLIGWRHERSPYMVIVAHFGHRRAGSQAQASRVLEEAASRVDTTAWPYPIIRYLRHEITVQDLMKAADNNDRMTEARAYIGMNLLLDGKQQEAVEHFRWVEASGRKTYLQYRLALAELKRLKI